MPAPTDPATPLTTTELLDFEARWPRHSGAKEEAIIAQLGVKPARFYQLLGRAAQSMAGLSHDARTARRVLARHANQPRR